MTRAVDVLDAGPLATVQDLGRRGWAHLGVPRSGALDCPALARANRIVGNPAGAAGLELTMGGCTLRPTATVVVALTGALADLTVDGHPAAWGLPVTVPGGATLTVGPATRGARCYLALAGGVDVPPVLGSRSTCTLSGLGPPKLAAGQRIPLGPPSGLPAGVDVAPFHEPETPLRLRVSPGPRQHWFSDISWRRLTGEPYRVSGHADRVGARLEGPPLERVQAVRGLELPSEGVVLGAVQVPADGLPLVFLADHPTTGGYPVIAVVQQADLPRLAQAVPGTPVTLVPAGESHQRR